ncbi:MAG: T9SS type A sorting domain-containing protein [Cryomorphaceae bacterium]|nr:T9SS type A sorting domain-containing protein [Flavobacteriales bacterium]
MKKIYFTLLGLLILTTQANAQDVWDNFEDIRVANYGFINGVFIPYNENPDQTGANTSQVAAEYSRNAAEEFDVLILNGVMADVTDYATGVKTMSIDVWSPEAGKTVQITLENTAIAENPYPAGRHSEYQATTTVAEQWETLEFELTGTPDGSVAPTILNQLVLLFDPGSNNGDTYYFDNLNGPELANNPCTDVTPDPSILNDFECNQNVNFLFSHSGINFRRIENPDTDVNESSHVAQYVRNDGEEFDVIIGRFDGNLNLSPNSEITLDVWDPNAPTEILVSLQNTDGDVILEMSAETSVSSEWQTLTYDPSDVADATDIGQFVILFDPESETSDEYYFDNFTADVVSSVSDVENLGDFTAFPNPAKDVVNFEFNLIEPASPILTLTDITGKVIHTENLSGQAAGTHLVTLNTSRFANGVYIYSLQMGREVHSGKVVINE